MVYRTGMHTMKTYLIHFRHLAMFLALWAAFASNITLANDVDDQGRLIAGPLETDLVERGYLFYPLRVLPLQTAPVSPNVSLPAVPLPQDVSPAPVPVPAPVAMSTTTPAPAIMAPQAAKPTAASVLVHRIEPIKAAPLPPAKSLPAATDQ
jgi:hypothetical protein